MVDSKNRTMLADALHEATFSPQTKLLGLPHEVSKKDLINTGNLIRSKLIKAERMVLDDGFVEACTAYSKYDFGVMRDLMYRARAPFDTTWIEWDEHVRHRNIEQPTWSSEGKPPEGMRVGILLEKIDQDEPVYRCTIFSTEPNEKRVMCMPLGFTFHCEDEMYGLEHTEDIHMLLQAMPNRQGNTDFDHLMMYFIGGSTDAAWWGNPVYQYEDALSMVCHGRWDLSGYAGRFIRRAYKEAHKDPRAQRGIIKMLPSFLTSVAGDFRWVISVLEMINMQNKILSLSDDGGKPGSGMIGGRIRPYFRQTRVRVMVPKDKLIRIMKRRAEAAIRRARHHVTGHWCESQRVGDRNCRHGWDESRKTPRFCTFCGAKQWWRPDFWRGDASIGMVIHEAYDVRHRKRVKHESAPPL